MKNKIIYLLLLITMSLIGIGMVNALVCETPSNNNVTTVQGAYYNYTLCRSGSPYTNVTYLLNSHNQTINLNGSTIISPSANTLTGIDTNFQRDNRIANGTLINFSKNIYIHQSSGTIVENMSLNVTKTGVGIWTDRSSYFIIRNSRFGGTQDINMNDTFGSGYIFNGSGIYLTCIGTPCTLYNITDNSFERLQIGIRANNNVTGGQWMYNKFFNFSSYQSYMLYIEADTIGKNENITVAYNNGSWGAWFIYLF